MSKASKRLETRPPVLTGQEPPAKKFRPPARNIFDLLERYFENIPDSPDPEDWMSYYNTTLKNISGSVVWNVSTTSSNISYNSQPLGLFQPTYTLPNPATISSPPPPKIPVQFPGSTHPTLDDLHQAITDARYQYQDIEIVLTQKQYDELLHEDYFGGSQHLSPYMAASSGTLFGVPFRVR